MSRLKSQIVFCDLTGGLNNVNSIDTINASPKKTESPDLCNVEFFKLGGIKSMEGNTLVGDKQDHSVIAGWEYSKGNNKYMMIGLSNGEVKIYNPADDVFDFVYAFPTPTDRMSFCNMNNGVVITNGKDDLVFYEKGRHQILSGTVDLTANSTEINGHSTEFETELMPGDTIDIEGTVYTVDTITSNTKLNVTEAPTESLSDKNIYLSEISQCNATLVNEEDPSVSTPIRGLAIQYYNGRLWVGGDNGVFYSQVGQYNKWDIKYDAGVIYSIYNDTSEVKALGLYSDYMLIHKEFNTYLLTCTGDATTIAVRPYSNVSCDSQQSWIVSNTKYYVYSREYMDIYPLTQRTVFSDKYIGEALTKKVRDVFYNLRDADVDKIFCVSYPKKRWMIFYMPMVDQLGSSYGLIFDFQCKAFLVRRLPQMVETTCAFNFLNNVYIGTENGLVLKEFSGNSFVYDAEYDDDEGVWVPETTPIISYFKSPWYDWLNDYTQSFSEFSINLSDEFNNNFYIRTFKDGMDRYEDRIIDTSSLSMTALVWDGIEGQDLPDNDTVWDQDDWVSGGFNGIRMLLPNNVFEKFQLEIGTNDDGQGFAIYGYDFRRIETDEAPW